MLKIGQTTGGLPLTEETFEIFRTSGIKAVEIRDPNPGYDAVDYPALTRLARTFGIELWSFHLPLVASNISKPDEGDAARSAVIIENLAAESYRRLRDVYFEQLLNERLLRDEESKEILADIFETPLVLPIEAVYDFKMAGNIFGFDGGDGNITSRADACREAVNKALDDFYAWG